MGSCFRGGKETVTSQWVREALDNGQDVNQQSPGGISGLMYATCGSHTDIVELLLLQPGIDINSPDNSGMTGGTPLHWAVARGGAGQVEVLLKQVKQKLEHSRRARVHASHAGNL